MIQKLCLSNTEKVKSTGFCAICLIANLSYNFLILLQFFFWLTFFPLLSILQDVKKKRKERKIFKTHKHTLHNRRILPSECYNMYMNLSLLSSPFTYSLSILFRKLFYYFVNPYPNHFHSTSSKNVSLYF